MGTEKKILIADSGSTKTSWYFLQPGGKKQFFQTEGINPFFRTTEDIEKELSTRLGPQIKETVDELFFYGAGIVNQQKAGGIRKALSALFPGAKMEVESDLLAAARATLGHKKGIACILGTGANSCLYDGGKITSHVPPLGFILGDEGSGAYLGRKLIADYLKKIMPEKLSRRFHQNYPLEYSDFLNRVYKEARPNQFLAGFVPFLKENIEEAYCASLVKDAFERFISRNVELYPQCRELPVSFAGSVAFHFREVLQEVLTQKKMKPGVIIQEPLLNLLRYHSGGE